MSDYHYCFIIPPGMGNNLVPLKPTWVWLLNSMSGSKNPERKHNEKRKRKTIYHWTYSKLLVFPLFKCNCSGWIFRKPVWPQWTSRLSGHQKDPCGDQLEHPACSVGVCRSSVPAFSRSPRDSSVSDTSNKGDRAAGESIGTSWKLFTDVSWENGKPAEQGSMCDSISAWLSSCN